ncbi:hypothetical protein J2805_003089 [Arthrobacter oryzae]|nr:hypothetical protein [Arthrobacter oryzae]
MQISLASVRHVGVSQSLWQRILRSGNISLDTGHGEDTVIPDVPEAAKFRNFVLDAIDELPVGVMYEADRARENDGDAPPYRPWNIREPWDTREQWDTREGGRDER